MNDRITRLVDRVMDSHPHYWRPAIEGEVAKLVECKRFSDEAIMGFFYVHQLDAPEVSENLVNVLAAQ